jgi:hypothetical protein
MFFSDDMRELVRLFDKHEVRFAVCGEFAVAYYGYIRSAYSPTSGKVSTSSSRVSAEGP